MLKKINIIILILCLIIIFAFIKRTNAFDLPARIDPPNGIDWLKTEYAYTAFFRTVGTLYLFKINRFLFKFTLYEELYGPIIMYPPIQYVGTIIRLGDRILYNLFDKEEAKEFKRQYEIAQKNGIWVRIGYPGHISKKLPEYPGSNESGYYIYDYEQQKVIRKRPPKHLGYGELVYDDKQQMYVYEGMIYNDNTYFTELFLRRGLTWGYSYNQTESILESFFTKLKIKDKIIRKPFDYRDVEDIRIQVLPGEWSSYDKMFDYPDVKYIRIQILPGEWSSYADISDKFITNILLDRKVANFIVEYDISRKTYSGYWLTIYSENY